MNKFRWTLPLLTAVLFTVAVAQTRGGTAVIGMIQEPGNLSRFVNSQSGSDLFNMVQEPMFIANADGEYLPLLAERVPTVANGDVSEDFLTVTYRLRDDLRWSDGEALTAADLVFTWEAINDPESTPSGNAIVPAYRRVASVHAVDDHTVEVRMSEVNPGYLTLWQAILPAHRFESSAVTTEHLQARMPLGTGPFIIREWRTGDRITLVRNPYYREEGKPYLDGITVRMVPDRQVALSSLIAGELDTVFFVATGDLPSLTEAQRAGRGVTVALQNTPSWVEWLWLNHRNPGTTGEPHPVLGDHAIRAAIDHAVDRDLIIEEVLGGFGSTTGSFIYAGFAAEERPATPHNPEQARAILEGAGWLPGSDGIRSKDGVRARIRFQTIAGDMVRELYQQVIQQNLRDVGIEAVIENVPSNLLFGAYADGGLIRTGNFDMAMSRDGYFVDPSVWAGVFTCAAIPSAENPSGFNPSLWCNEAFDAAVEAGGGTADLEARRAAYARAIDIFATERVSLPLYASAWGWAWHDRLQGVDTGYWLGMWPSAANWHIDE